MGLFDSDSEQRASEGQAGSQTQQGDPTSVQLTAGDDQRAEVNITNQMVDGGLVEAAEALAQGTFGFAEDVVTLGGRAFDFGERALEANEDTVSESLEFAGDNVEQGYYFASEVFDSAIETVESAATQAVGSANAALQEVNRDASERTSRIMLYVAGGIAAAAVLGVLLK